MKTTLTLMIGFIFAASTAQKNLDSLYKSNLEYRRTINVIYSEKYIVNSDAGDLTMFDQGHPAGRQSALFSELYPITNCPTMVFMEGKNMASGYSGCHEFTTSVTINNNSMVFAENAMQDTTCCGIGENIFLSHINRVNAYAFKDDKTLVLIADDKPVMAFTRLTRESYVVSRDP